MALRTISVGGVNDGFYNGDSPKFTVISDTGPVYGQAKIIGATMELNSILTTRNDIQLLVKFNSASAEPVAKTEALKKDASGYWNTSVALTDCTSGLLGTLSSMYLTVSSGNVDKYLKDIAFNNSIIMIDVEYMAGCTEPGNVRLSATQSAGESVLLSWGPGTGTTDNTFDHYEVARQYSTDGGSTWSGWETVGETTQTYMWVYPPETSGRIYQYYVRTVGSAGDDYASYWVGSSNTLRKKVYPALIAYTDPGIVPGTTKVKAAHITELQTNVNLTREAATFAAYGFTAIRASYTSLGDWNAHILELRAAIDGMGISHETWLALGENCPRADVIMQLRRVVEAVAND